MQIFRGEHLFNGHQTVCGALWGLLLCVSTTALAQDDPSPITDLSETETTYAGAQLLRSGEHVQLGELRAGRHDDLDERDRYLFWQGDSLFLGVIDTVENNRLDVVAEFYWFESSLPRNSDFYVIVLKVTAAPATNTDWRIATPASIFDSVLFRDIGSVHRVEASMDRNGANGAIRWDWSVPFQNYRWEPERVIEIEQEYAAGAHVEGSAMRDLSGGVNVQAKGFLDAQTRVSTRYTITLWRWEMLVQAGATDMDWALIALSPEHEQDPAYHEYFLVLQSERNVPVRISHLQFATSLRKRNPLFFDEFKDISIRLRNVELTAPQPSCDEGFVLENGACVEDCPEGYEWDGDNCQMICPTDEFEVDGSCEFICEDGRLSASRMCSVEPSCPEGERPEGEDCVSLCTPEQHWEEGRCVDPCPSDQVVGPNGCEPNCAEGYRAEAGACVSICPEDSAYVNGECEQTCASDAVEREGECVSICPEGFSLLDGQCQSLCPEGTSFSEGRCVLPCPDGSLLVDGMCVALPEGGVEEEVEVNAGSDDQDLEQMEAIKEGGCASYHAPQSTLRLIALLMMLGLTRRLTQRARQN